MLPLEKVPPLAALNGFILNPSAGEAVLIPASSCTMISLEPGVEEKLAVTVQAPVLPMTAYASAAPSLTKNSPFTLLAMVYASLPPPTPQLSVTLFKTSVVFQPTNTAITSPDVTLDKKE